MAGAGAPAVAPVGRPGARRSLGRRRPARATPRATAASGQAAPGACGHRNSFFHWRRAARTSLPAVARRRRGRARCARPRAASQRRNGLIARSRPIDRRQRGLVVGAQRLAPAAVARRARRCRARPRGRSAGWTGCTRGRSTRGCRRAAPPGATASACICAGVPSNRRPQPPENSVSPQNSSGAPSRSGGSRRCGRRCGPARRSPRSAGRARSTVSPSCERLERAAGCARAPGRRPGPCSRGRRASTPPTWSPWWWVTRIAGQRETAAASSARVTGAASPGSTTTASRPSCEHPDVVVGEGGQGDEVP